MPPRTRPQSLAFSPPTLPPDASHRPSQPRDPAEHGQRWTPLRVHIDAPAPGAATGFQDRRRQAAPQWDGLRYTLDLHLHDDWAALKASPAAPHRCWLLTTHAERPIWDADFADGDALVFGNEGHGAPEWLHDEVGAARRITIPRFSEKPLRSLNLSTAAGIALYEALRQLRRPCPTP
jgi:tRNA(Leu) C34 or U34 (ribose-2'-O)-methylase TrmL